MMPSYLHILILLCGILAACNTALPPLPNSQFAPHLLVTNRVTLASNGDELVDLRADNARVYVTDSTDHLHVLARHGLAPLQTMAVNGGQLTLDDKHHRLYVAPGNRYMPDAELPHITIIDTQTLHTIGTLPGRYVSVDTVHNRIYTGSPLTLEIEQAPVTQPPPDGVRLYDGATLAELAVGQPGIPVYNPARAELLIVAYTLYTADAQTLIRDRDLVPELAEQELRWCTGCERVDAATVLPANADGTDLLLLESSTDGGGKGSGIASTPRWLNARTLAPIARAPAMQQMCGSQRVLRPAVDGRLYRSLAYSRYQEVYNVLVENLMGVALRQMDGLQLLYADDLSGEGIAALSGAQNLLIDMTTAAPSGLLPAFCLLGVDATAGTLYGAAGGDLLKVAITSEIESDTVANSIPDNGPVNITISVLPNPDAPQEQFGLDASSILYHSADGGQTWRRVAGGLPAWTPADSAMATLQPSPNFAADQTLFWAASINKRSGLGVWRSTDGGNSWRPVWRGLDHLRVAQLEISPNFATDHTLWAVADFALLAEPAFVSQINEAASGDAASEGTIQVGRSLWRSTNRGDAWELVATAADDAALPARE